MPFTFNGRPQSRMSRDYDKFETNTVCERCSQPFFAHYGFACQDEERLRRMEFPPPAMTSIAKAQQISSVTIRDLFVEGKKSERPLAPLVEVERQAKTPPVPDGCLLPRNHRVVRED